MSTSFVVLSRQNWVLGKNNVFLKNNWILWKKFSFLRNRIKMRHKTLSTVFCHYRILIVCSSLIHRLHENNNKETRLGHLEWLGQLKRLIYFVRLFFVNKDELCQFQWEQRHIFCRKLQFFHDICSGITSKSNFPFV